jgi:hypothetical protein
MMHPITIVSHARKQGQKWLLGLCFASVGCSSFSISDDLDSESQVVALQPATKATNRPNAAPERLGYVALPLAERTSYLSGPFEFGRCYPTPAVIPLDAKAVVVHAYLRRQATTGASPVGLVAKGLEGAQDRNTHLYFNPAEDWASNTVTIATPEGSRAICIKTDVPVQALFDYVGYYANGGGLLTLVEPRRVREPKTTKATEFEVSLPPGVSASALVLSVSTRAGSKAAHLQNHDCKRRPDADGPWAADFPGSSDTSREIIAPIPVGQDKTCFAIWPMDKSAEREGLSVVVDLLGYFGGTGALAFVPLPAGHQLVDQVDSKPLLTSDKRPVVLTGVLPKAAVAVVGQLMVVPGTQDGYAKIASTTKWRPEDTSDESSNINFKSGAIVTNQITLLLEGGPAIAGKPEVAVGFRIGLQGYFEQISP